MYTTSGGTLAHILSYAKNGDRSTSDVVITEVVPDHTTVNAAGSTAGWSCADGSPAGTVCALSVGNPNAEENDTVIFGVTVDVSLPAGVEQIENSAAISGDGVNGDDANPEDNQDGDVTPVVGAAPDVATSNSTAPASTRTTTI